MAATVYYDDRSFQFQLKQALRILENPKAMMRDMGIQSEAGIEENFDREVDSTGRKWQGLSARTLAARRKKGAGAKILRDTGKLSTMNSEAKRKSVLVGTSVNYGGPHQTGTRTIPQREWLYISQKLSKKLMKVVELHVSKFKFGKRMA